MERWGDRGLDLIVGFTAVGESGIASSRFGLEVFSGVSVVSLDEHLGSGVYYISLCLLASPRGCSVRSLDDFSSRPKCLWRSRMINISPGQVNYA